LFRGTPKSADDETVSYSLDRDLQNISPSLQQPCSKQSKKDFFFYLKITLPTGKYKREYF